MKIRTKKQGFYTLRRARVSDKSKQMREGIRLSFFLDSKKETLCNQA